MIVGKKDWIIPDCELPPEGEGVLKGHESVVIVNDSDEKAVIKAYGPPPACRTPDLRNGTWIYWSNTSDIVRLIFRADRVRTILTSGQNQ